MDLSKIITVAGRSGLYRILAQGRQALIVESLATASGCRCIRRSA